MSEEIPETADAAVRGWFVAAGFTCVLIGGELIVLHSATLGGIALLVASTPFYWAAYKWIWLKSKIDAHLVRTIGAIATDARWWFGALFLILFALILSPFVEEGRWPFSASVAELQTQLDATKRELAAERQKPAASQAPAQPQSAPTIRPILPTVDISGDLTILSNEEVRVAAYVLASKINDYVRVCIAKSIDIDRNQSISDVEKGTLTLQLDASCSKDFRTNFLSDVLKLQAELQRRLKEKAPSATKFPGGILGIGDMGMAATLLAKLAKMLP